jgi:predicted dehydrogenase
MGGGVLRDAGTYCVSFVRVMAGKPPTRAIAHASWTETGVDKTLVATLEFNSGLVAQIACSYATAYHRHGQIAGELGVIDSHFVNHPPIGGPAKITLRHGATASIEVDEIACEGGNGFLFEAESFARWVGGDAAGWNGAVRQESLDIAATVDAIMESARSGKSVDVIAPE